MTDLYLGLSSVWKLMIMKCKLVYTRTGVERIFFQGGSNSGLSRGSQKAFRRGPNVAKFHFNHSKPRNQSFFTNKLIRKYQVSKYALPTPMYTRL